MVLGGTGREEVVLCRGFGDHGCAERRGGLLLGEGPEG